MFISFQSSFPQLVQIFLHCTGLNSKLVVLEGAFSATQMYW